MKSRGSLREPGVNVVDRSAIQRFNVANRPANQRWIAERSTTFGHLTLRRCSLLVAIRTVSMTVLFLLVGSLANFANRNAKVQIDSS
jgi:hypothetical protein